jgi:hypothetical protein
MANPKKSNSDSETSTSIDQSAEVKPQEESTPSASTEPVFKLPEVGATAEVIRSSYTQPAADSRLVKMLVGYPKDFKGKKYMKDGENIEVSHEAADKFESMGIAKRIE